jgi:hypothetical protein
MSRRKQTDKPVLLGPDGKPWVAPKKERTGPTPERVAELESAAVVDESYVFPTSLLRSLTLEFNGVSFAGSSESKPKATETLASKVKRQVDALAADFDGQATAPELPRPEPDLHTYADAYASAVKKCPHPNLEDTIHSRGEYMCLDCQRYLTTDEVRRAREWNSGGWFFR